MLPIAFAVDLGGFTFLLWVWRPRGRRRALALIPANERG
jgi:hypothetical protein